MQGLINEVELEFMEAVDSSEFWACHAIYRALMDVLATSEYFAKRWDSLVKSVPLQDLSDRH